MGALRVARATSSASSVLMVRLPCSGHTLKRRHLSLLHPLPLFRGAQGQVIALLVRPCFQDIREGVRETRCVAPVKAGLCAWLRWRHHLARYLLVPQVAVGKSHRDSQTWLETSVNQTVGLQADVDKTRSLLHPFPLDHHTLPPDTFFRGTQMMGHVCWGQNPSMFEVFMNREEMLPQVLGALQI